MMMHAPITSPSASANIQPESSPFRRLRLSFSLRFWLFAIEVASLVFIVTRWGELAGHLAVVGMLAEWVLFLVGRKPYWAWVGPTIILGTMIVSLPHALPTGFLTVIVYFAILLVCLAEIVHLRSIWRTEPLPEGVVSLHKAAPPLRPVIRGRSPRRRKAHNFIIAPPAATTVSSSSPAPVPTPRDENDLLALLFPESEAPVLLPDLEATPAASPQTVLVPSPPPAPRDKDEGGFENESLVSQTEPEPLPVLSPAAVADLDDTKAAEEEEEKSETRVEVETSKSRYPRIKIPRIKPTSFVPILPRPHRSRLSLVSVPMATGEIIPVLANKTNTVLICVGDRLTEWSDLENFLMDIERAPGLVFATVVAPASEAQTTWYLEVSRPPNEALVLARPLFSRLQVASFSLVEHAEEATKARLDVADGGVIKVKDQYYSVAITVAPFGGGTIDHVVAGTQRLATLGRNIILQGRLLDKISWVLADLTQPDTEQVEDIETFLAERDNELLTRGLFAISPLVGQAKELLKWNV